LRAGSGVEALVTATYEVALSWTAVDFLGAQGYVYVVSHYIPVQPYFY
jgi:hypothetical protein